MIIDTFRRKYRFLSNDYPSPIARDGLIYPTVEHAYQAAKFEGPEIKRWLSRLDEPWQARKAANSVPVKRPDWDDIRIYTMVDLLREKFSAPPLRARLLATGNADLIYGNNGDQYWGVVDGVGHNYLGVILMAVRTEIQVPGGKCNVHFR